MSEYMEEMSEHTTPSASTPKSRWTVNYCTVPWDPTCSGRTGLLEPTRISFPDLLEAFPRLERYRATHGQATEGFKDALDQIREGKKDGHWIYWILPQIFGEVSHHKPGENGSPHSQKFALESLYEAIAFLCHPELGQHYFDCIAAIRDQIEPPGRNGGQGRTLNEIFNKTDARKVRCSVTLFRRLAGWCYALSPESYATLIANCDAILVAASRDGHRPCDHVPELYREFEESLEDPQKRAKMQEMFPVKCVHCGESVWPPDHNWRFVHKWCVEDNFLTSLVIQDDWPPPASEPLTYCVPIGQAGRFSYPPIERVPKEQWEIEQWRFYPTIEHVEDDKAQLLESYQISVLDLGNRARHCLQSAEIATVGELDSRTEEELLAIRNMGAGSVNEIQAKLHQFKDRMGSGNWDGPPPVRYESQKSRQDWLQNLAPEDDVPLGELGLDPTLVGFLEGNDIRWVAQLVSLTEEELMAVRSLGSGKAAKIRAGLERFGWRLGDVSSFSEGRRRLHSALAEQSLEAESEQREAKDLVWPLVSDGCSVDRIVESTGLPEAAVREARNAWMVEQRIAGASNRTIGETVGMSAEAVRRSIKRADNLESVHIRELRAARLEGSIRDTVISMPGSSLDEIAEKAGISRNVVRRKLTRLGTKLVWDVNGRNRSRVKKWSDEQLLQALQSASSGSRPLTVTAYDGLVTRGDIKGPTGQVFSLRFGSWRKACEAAGVQCGESTRDNYTSEWSETDLEALVVEFLFSSEHDGSFVEFQRWLDERPNYPSMATIRTRLGRWGSMKQKAVEEVVAAGRFAELCALCA